MSANPVFRDHAADAAKLLRRLAIFILAVLAPTFALFSRNAAALALPVAAAVLGFGAIVDPERRPLFKRMLAGLSSPLVLVFLYVVFWFACSLLWTPFAGSAAGRLSSAVGVGLAAAFALLALPERMRASTLNLIPIGVFLAAILGAVLFAATSYTKLPAWLAGDRSVHERGVTLICLLSFVGAGWLASRGRRIDAVALLIVVAAMIAVQRNLLMIVAFGAGLFAFGLSRISWRVTVALIAVLASTSLALLPLLPSLLSLVDPAAIGLTVADANAIERMNRWLWSDPLRFITGHGFDTLRHAIRAGLIPAEAMRAPHVELWYEAGLPGVGAALFAVLATLAWASRQASDGVAAATLGVLAAVAVYSAIGFRISQNWWLVTVAIAVIAIASIVRGQFRTKRPAARHALPR